MIAIVCGCHKKSYINKVEFAKSFCFGSCVAAAISIDNSGNYKIYTDSSFNWELKRKRPAIRSYIGKMDRDNWNKLTALLNDVNYRVADTTKEVKVSDQQEYEVFVYDGNLKRKLTKPYKIAYTIYKFIDSTAHLAILKRVPDTLSFGTTMQIDPRLLHRKFM